MINVVNDFEYPDLPDLDFEAADIMFYREENVEAM